MRKTRNAKTTTRETGRRAAVGDRVDVFCDHNQAGERVRGWLQGIVVQADEKMIAVQFIDDVYLTDGWMVPDRVLRCRQGADNIRPSSGRRRTSRISGRLGGRVGGRGG